MDMSEVKAFNSELSGLYENKPPISKAKMSAITKGAIKAIKFYKHVVHSVEKFIQKCKPEYKVPGLYVIDSIVRQSRHQFGQDKDVFAPRFAKNMQQTFANLFRCPPEDKRNIIRVLNLWQKNHVFTPDVIQPLLDMADPNHPLHQEIQAQQNAANGSALNISHTDVKNSPMAQQHSPHMASPPGEQFQDQPSSGNNVKFNRKLLNDFEYDSEDDTHSEPAPPPLQPQNNTDALGSILTNPEIMRQLQSLQAQMQMMTGMQISNLMPMMPDMHLSQQQNQNAPFLNPQIPDPPKLDNREQKDEVANESDIEFVDSGPQVIEIPDANDSRSPSPSRSRRHRSRSPKSRARRRSRTRSRSRGKDRRRDRDKSYKEREADKEKQREREKKGLPPIKKENLSVCSTTLWVGHLSKLATPEELSDLFGEVGGVASIDVVAPRGCAFVVMERRRDAAKALSKLNKHKLHSKEITVAWAPGKGVKGREWKDYWEAEWGVSYLPWRRLQELWQLSLLSLDALEDGGVVDEDTLPSWLPPRMMSKPLMDMPMIQIPGTNPPPPSIPHLPMPTGLPGAPLTAIPTPIPTAMPAAIPAAMPTAVAATTLRPAISATVTGMQGEIRTPAPLIQFPPTMPPPAGGMVPSFLGGLMGMGGIMPLHLARPPPQIPQQINQQQQQQQSQPEAVTHTDDAMDLDTEDTQNEMQTETKIEQVPTTAPTMLAPDELLAFLSKPPPNFKASEPPPPLFNKQMEEPANAGNENNNNENRRDDRDRDRRDRDRDRRDRDRERRDRDRRDRGDRRGDRGRDDRERDDRRDRDRDRDRGRDRRDRDRDRDRDKDRYSRDNNERMRERSPRHSNNADVNNDKTLQERLWDMANGKNEKRSEDNAPRLEDKPAVENNSQQMEEDRPRLDYPPPLLETPANTIEEVPSVPNSDSGWTQLPTPRLPQMAPTFRADLRMRGPPRPPLRGPWPEGPPFGPRFNGMPPFTRPPFDRPPFDNPMFDGPPRFERPPFNRMAMPPFNGPMPPFDGSRPPFDGPRPPFDGSRPPFDGPMPPFDPTRPPFDGPMPNFDSPRLYDGPPEYFDRNNRRFDDREQFNDRGWNGDREWDRRGNNEWEDRRRDRRPRDQEERFNGRDRRNFEDRTSRDNREQQHSKENKEEIPPQENIFNTESAEEVPKLKEDRPRRDRDRKSRWGAPEDIVEQLQQLQDAQEAEFLMAMEEASRDNHLQASETLCYQEKESTNTNLNENIQISNESQSSIVTTSQEEENTNVTQTKDVLYAQEIQAQITNIENAYGIPESENVPERDETTDSQASSQIEAASFVHSDDTRGNIEMFDAPAVENDNSESVFVKEMTEVHNIVESNLATNDTRLSALETNDPPLETDPALPAETDHETNDAALERDIALEGA